MDVELEMALDATYTCKLLTELPQPMNEPHVFYPGATESGGRDGVLIRVHPAEHPSWIGTFAFGINLMRAKSGIFSSPDPDWFVVASRGAVYRVAAADPTLWELLGETISEVRQLPAQKLLVMSDGITLLAYGASAFQWRTARLGWDEVKISNVTENAIHGQAWDAGNNKMVSFLVDPATGRHQGGVQFPEGIALTEPETL